MDELTVFDTPFHYDLSLVYFPALRYSRAVLFVDLEYCPTLWQGVRLPRNSIFGMLQRLISLHCHRQFPKLTSPAVNLGQMHPHSIPVALLPAHQPTPSPTCPTHYRAPLHNTYPLVGQFIPGEFAVMLVTGHSMQGHMLAIGTNITSYVS